MTVKGAIVKFSKHTHLLEHHSEEKNEDKHEEKKDDKPSDVKKSESPKKE